MFNTLESDYILNITKEIVEKGIDSNCYKERNVVNIDKEKLIELLKKHKLLACFSDFLNKDFRNDAFITSQVRYIKDRRALYVKEMIQICNLLQNNDINYVIVKGMPLSKIIFNNEFFRMIGDIDIVVKENNLQKGYTLLKSLGYNQIQNEDNDEFIFAWGSFFHEIQMVKKLECGSLFFVELKRGTSAGYVLQLLI